MTHRARPDRASKWLATLPPAEAVQRLLGCCGAAWWVEQLAAGLPYHDDLALASAADRAFDAMPESAWLEAFAHHPMLGDMGSLKMRFAGNSQWSAGEQSGVQAADDVTLTRLAALNAAYSQRFGWQFILCATGLRAADMVASLEARLPHEPRVEFAVACGEQRKITHLRLAKLAASAGEAPGGPTP